MILRLKHIALLIIIASFTLAAKKGYNKQLKDLEILKTTLLNKEGIIDLHISKSDINQSFQNLEIELQSKKTLLEQFKLYSSVISSLQCGHTQVHPNKETLREWLATRNTLPIDYYLIGKKLIVNKIDQSDYHIVNDGKSKYQSKKKIKANSEILTIDGKTINEMMMKMGKYISSDEDFLDFKYHQATQYFEFYRHLSFPFDKDSIHVSYVTKMDTNEIYLVPGIAPVNTMNLRIFEETEQYKKDGADMGKFKIIDKYGYFRFKSFIASYGMRYDLFLEQSFKKLKKAGIDKLVIDLRGNTGGSMQYSFMRYMVGEDVELGRYVVEKPSNTSSGKFFRKFKSDYRKHVRLSRRQNKLQKRNKFNGGIVKTTKVDSSLIFNGDIILITDEGTFSSASILACHLKTMKNAKIIGRAPGGSFYAGNAGTLQVKLPYSGFSLFVNPNTFYSHLEPNENPFEIKKPDLEINPIIFNSKKLDAHYFKAATKLFN